MATRPHRLPSPSASGDAPDQGVARNRRSSRLLGLSAAFATAALVLAALAMSYGAYRLSHADPERVKPASVPALVVASATPPSVVTVEPLFATLLPADQIPAAGVLDFVVNRLALDPGVTAPVSPDVQSCCSGPQITHVLEGELSVRVEGPAQVFRAGVTRDAANGGSAPPGNEVVLHPGDTMIADFALPTTYDNRGSSPVHVVAIGLYAGTLPGPWADGFTFLDGNEELPQDPRPAGPAELRLTRVTLPPDGVVPTPRPGALVLEVGVNGDASIGKRADGSLRNLSEHAETIYVVTVEPAAMSMLGLPS